MPFNRANMKSVAAALAAKGVFVGTSSWKYPGWRGQLYDEARYVRYGRFSKTRFENLCLTEYAEVFKTVSVDAAYYRFPEPHALENLAPSDSGVAMLRHLLREQLRRIEDGQDPINVVRDPTANHRIATYAWNTVLSPAEAAAVAYSEDV